MKLFINTSRKGKTNIYSTVFFKTKQQTVYDMYVEVSTKKNLVKYIPEYHYLPIGRKDGVTFTFNFFFYI